MREIVYYVRNYFFRGLSGVITNYQELSRIYLTKIKFKGHSSISRNNTNPVNITEISLFSPLPGVLRTRRVL